jgi:short subunit dehydrogenase-like uncharacterized protein
MVINLFLVNVTEKDNIFALSWLVRCCGFDVIQADYVLISALAVKIKKALLMNQ